MRGKREGKREDMSTICGNNKKVSNKNEFTSGDFRRI